MKKYLNLVDDLTLAFGGKIMVRDEDGNSYDYINGFLCVFKDNGEKIINPTVVFKKDYFFTLVEPKESK